MSITIEEVVDQTVVEANGIVLYRTAKKVLDNGQEIAKSYHRASLAPGQSTDGVPAIVVSICNTVWTQDVIDAYNESLED
jgi:hypothetical protein